MKSKIEFTVLFLLGFVLGLVLLSNDARAQQQASGKTDKDKTQPTAAANPQTDAETPYTINSSIEFGVRGALVEGNADRYRSDLNYTPGFRVFDSSFSMKSKDNNAPVLDALTISSFGWGTDPNKYLRVNAEKTKTYRFDANYRRFDYFNSLSYFALGQHTSNTEYRQGDFNLTVLPQNERIRFNLGYSLDRNSGPSVSTVRFNGDEYPALVPVRMAADEYRVGAEAKVWVFDIAFMQGWRYFKEDNQYLINVPNAGNNLTNTATINDFYRNAPVRGTTPFTRFNVHTLIAKKLDFTGRYIYTSGSTDYTFFQNGHGKDSSGNTVTSDIIVVNSTAKRPNGMGDLAATFFVTDSFRISDTFRVNSFRINGGDLLSEALLRTKIVSGVVVPVTPVLTNTTAFRSINYRRYLNTVEGDYDFGSRFSVHAGYRYTNRHMIFGANDIVNNAAAPEPEVSTFDNTTNTFIFGFKAKPVKIWSLYFDLEKGSTDNVFTRVDNYDVTNVRIRSILRANKRLTFNASLVTKDNNNPSITESGQNFGVNTKSRNFSSSFDWTPNEKVTFSGGYTRANLTSDAQIIFFVASSAKINGESRYFMRDNFFFVNAYVQIHPRIRFFAGYDLHNDPGQNDRISTTNMLIGSFPYDLQSPQMKLVFKLHRNVDWIGGYQYFGYQENFPNPNHAFYHVHLPYTSLRIFFGRE